MVEYYSGIAQVILMAFFSRYHLVLVLVTERCYTQTMSDQH